MKEQLFTPENIHQQYTPAGDETMHQNSSESQVSSEMSVPYDLSSEEEAVCKGQFGEEIDELKEFSWKELFQKVKGIPKWLEDKSIEEVKESRDMYEAAMSAEMQARFLILYLII